MKKILGLGALISILFLISACATHVGVASLGLKQATINLTAVPAQNTLEPQGNQGCVGAGNNQGCVIFDTGEIGTVTFSIRNGQKNLVCDGSPPEPQWVIRKIRLSNKGTVTSGKGDFTAPYASWMEESFPQFNELTGVVYEAGLESATSSAVVVNLNEPNVDAFIYYEVTASNCTETAFLVTDPRVQNKGR